MKPAILILGVLCLLAPLGLLIIWESPDAKQGEDDSSITEIAEPSSSISIFDVGLIRDSIDPPSEVSLTWRDQLHLMPEFQRRFWEIFVTEGGEQRAKKHVEESTRYRIDTDNWSDVSSALEGIENAKMAFSNQTTYLFDDVVYVEYSHIAGLLNQQIQNWKKWQVCLDEGHLRNYPLDRVAKYPLNFPPELHLALMTGGAGAQALPSEILAQAAGIRDRFVRRAGAIELERYIMLGAISQTVRESSISIPSGEWEEAISVLLPSYLGVREAEARVEQGYIYELQSLLFENGYEISAY